MFPYNVVLNKNHLEQPKECMKDHNYIQKDKHPHQNTHHDQLN